MTNPPAKGARAALYAYAASTEQTNHACSEPLADQVALCRLYAEAHGWKVVGVYEDSAIPRGKPRKRLMQMLQHAADRAFDVLLVRHLDRLGRNGVQDILNMLNAINVVVGIVPDLPAACEECAQAQQDQEASSCQDSQSAERVQSGVKMGLG